MRVTIALLCLVASLALVDANGQKKRKVANPRVGGLEGAGEFLDNTPRKRKTGPNKSAPRKRKTGPKKSAGAGKKYKKKRRVVPGQGGGSATVDALLNDAIALAEDGDLQAALAIFEQLVDKQPQNGKYHENLGVTQMRLMMLPEARLSFERARAILPTDDDSIQRNFVALEETEAGAGSGSSGGGSQASSGYDDYGSSGGNYGSDYDGAYGDVSDTEDADKAINEAIVLAESGDVVSALGLFKEAVRMNPILPSVHENLGVTQMRLGLLDDAKASFNKAKALQRGRPASSLADNMGFLEEHYAHARKIKHNPKTMYEEFVQGGSSGDGYGDGYGDDAYGTDAYGSSYGASNGGDSSYGGGSSYSGDYGDEDGYEDGDAEALTSKAIALAESGEVEESLEFFEKAVKLSPVDPSMFENLGVTEMRLGLLDRAKASFNKVKKLSRGSPQPSIDANIEALEEHFKHAAFIGHDTSTIYPPDHESRGRGPVSSGYDGDAYGGSYDSYDSYGSGSGSSDPYDIAYDSEFDDYSGDKQGLVNQAISLAEAGDLSGALPLFEKAAKSEPKNGQGFENLGVSGPKKELAPGLCFW